MHTQENDLLRFAKEAADSLPDQQAFVVNLSGVPKVEDHGIFRVMARRLREKVFGENALAFPLAQFRIVYVVDTDLAQAARSELERMANFLRENARGTIEYDHFPLSTEAEPFLRAVHRLNEFGQTNEDHSRKSQSAVSRQLNWQGLASFEKIESLLKGANIDSLIRSQSIHSLTSTAAPRVVARELVVSLDYLEELFSTPIQGNPWLFERVTDLLDRRMLYHLMRETAAPNQPMAIKLHVSTALSQEFAHMVEQLTADRHETLLVLLPFLEVKADPARARLALSRLESAGIHGGIDSSPWSAIEMEALADPLVDFIKFPYGPDWLQMDQDQLDRVAERAAAIGVDKIIMNRCVDDKSVEIGRSMGFVLFEGKGADAVAERMTTEWRKRIRDAQLAEMRNASGQSAPTSGKSADDEAKALFSKILGKK
ncbi:MAG: hypothetical protein HOL85_00940 [Rhodospirillaceae bacterium]|jgi:hypothetical protein|nr:hypothetical protein [Rhodospirillaceae bacterium]MBT6137705.1 hypothetical protein [Rhodospirillaceae bacterium]